jgi:trehalose/maltose hydrolase-like predicted phosphorylase
LLSHRFTQEETRRNYDYYEKVTTHDSSLSTCIFSIVASDIGYHDKAYRYFMRTARMDLDDYHGNVKDGVHVANMAGTWMCLVNGFAGLKVHDDTLSLNPYLPAGWDEYSFKFTHQDRTLSVVVDRTSATYELLAGEDLEIRHKGSSVTLRAGQKIGQPLLV